MIQTCNLSVMRVVLYHCATTAYHNYNNYKTSDIWFLYSSESSGAEKAGGLQVGAGPLDDEEGDGAPEVLHGLGPVV